MNHIYRSIWNATLGCWVAAPETARAGGKTSCSECSNAEGISLHWNGVAGAIAIAWGLAAAVPAYAACTGTASVTCSGGIIEGYVSSTDNLTLNVQADAQIVLGASSTINSVFLTGSGTAVNNFGKINPSILRELVSPASGLQISNTGGTR